MLKDLIQRACAEDSPAGDVTTEAVFGKTSKTVTARFLAKQTLVVSGWLVVRALIRYRFPKLKLKIFFHEASLVKKGSVLAEVRGPLAQVLMFERLALNFLQHLSGIATLTRAFVQKIRGTRAQIFDTRKTLPGLRSLEKLAVVHGGGKNHRMNLSDQYLLKDNHIDAAGSLSLALQNVSAHRKRHKKNLKIEIEVRDLNECAEALYFAPHIVMLDNMTLSQVKQAVSLRDALAKKTLLEVSGGITLKTVGRFAKLGIDRIAVGAITHSAPAVDISLKIW